MAATLLYLAALVGGLAAVFAVLCLLADTIERLIKHLFSGVQP